MAGPENRGFVENFTTGVRNAGILAAVLGVIAILVELPIAGPLVAGGTVVAVTGEVGKRAAGSGKS